MNKDELRKLIRTIGLHLSADHGTITTDHPDATVTEISWEIDNSNALEALKQIADHLGVTVDDISK